MSKPNLAHIVYESIICAALVAGLLTALSAQKRTVRPPTSCSNTWIGGASGDWGNKGNWSTGSVPGTGDSVCILSGAAVGSSDNGMSAANLDVGSGNTLTLSTIPNTNNSLNVDGSTIVNDGQIIIPYDSSTGTYTLLALSSGGNVTLSGAGSIIVTNKSGITGSGPGATLINQSTIAGSGGIQNDLIVNNTSSGVVNANQTGVPFVFGRFNGPATNTGVMKATGGGQLVIGSLTLNNVGGQIQAVGSGSSVTFAAQGAGGQTITGGTLASSGGGVLYTENSTTLDGTSGNTITNTGTLILPSVGSNAGSSFQGMFNNSGIIQILNTGGGVGLNIPGGQTFTLTGSGTLTMGDGTSNAYNNQNNIGGGTFANEQTVSGAGNILNLTAFSNSGTITANTPVGANNLQLQLGRAGTGTNTGLLEATNGGSLVIGSTTINNVGGTIAATGTNSAVSLVGSLGQQGLTIEGGTYKGSGGGIVYGEGGTTLDGTSSMVMNAGMFVVQDTHNNSFNGINAQGMLSNTGTLQVLSSGDQVFLQIPNGESLTLTGNGDLVMGDGTDNSNNLKPTIGANFGTNGTFTNHSKITGTGSIGSGTGGVTNTGVMNANVPVGTNGLELFVGRLNPGGVFLNSGTIEASNGGEFGFDPNAGLGTFTNKGTVLAAAKSRIDLTNVNTFTNLAGTTLTGGTYNVTGTLLIPGDVTTNAAHIVLNGAASQLLDGNSNNALAGLATISTPGTFTVSAGRTFTSAGAFTNLGAVTIGKGSTFTVGAGGNYTQNGGRTSVSGILTTSGSIEITKGSLLGSGGNVEAGVTSSGTVMAAASTTTTGKLTFTGAYTQSAAGALTTSIAGANAGQFNVLNVTGTANLAGTLNIVLLKKFVPLVGATFEILTAPDVKGTFATVNGASINSSEHFTVTYNSNNVTLDVVSGP